MGNPILTLIPNKGELVFFVARPTLADPSLDVQNYINRAVLHLTVMFCFWGVGVTTEVSRKLVLSL